jgi:hypothetical protein
MGSYIINEFEKYNVQYININDKTEFCNNIIFNAKMNRKLFSLDLNINFHLPDGIIFPEEIVYKPHKENTFINNIIYNKDIIYCRFYCDDINLNYMPVIIILIDGTILILEKTIIFLESLKNFTGLNQMSKICINSQQNNENYNIDKLKEDCKLIIFNEMNNTINSHPEFLNTNKFEKINDIIDLHINSSLSENINLIQNEAYKKSLQCILQKMYDLKKEYFDNGFRLFDLFKRTLKKNGYKETNPLYFSKSVDIIPERFIHQSSLYDIDTDDLMFSIKDICYDFNKIDLSNLSNCIVFAPGSVHPNVCSNGLICLGSDLDKELHNIFNDSHTDSSTIEDFIKEVEKVLEIINFDSAYEELSCFDINYTKSESQDIRMNKNINKYYKTPFVKI